MIVKAWLKGHQFDLEALAELFPTGDVCVVREGDEYYLAAAEIDSPPGGRKFYEVAPEVLQRVNGLARAMRPNDFRPVELVGRYQVGENQHHVVLVDYAEASLSFRDKLIKKAVSAVQRRDQLSWNVLPTQRCWPMLAASGEGRDGPHLARFARFVGNTRGTPETQATQRS